MPSKTHQTAVVLIPPPEVWEPIQAIRRLRDRQVRRWMPHVTLLYPFRPREAFESLEGPFAEALRGVAPFAIELSEIRWFRHGRTSWTLWLDPRPREPLADLQARLQALVPDCDDVRRHEGGFHPHLSLGQLRGDERALEALRAQLQGSWTPLRFAAREVSLIWRGAPPDDAFRVDRTVELFRS